MTYNSEINDAEDDNVHISEVLSDAPEAQFTVEEQKHIIRRVDRRLVTTLGILYMCSLMDRTNLAVANIAGMSEDLHLKVGARYSLIVLVFFIPYVLFQPPATVVIRKIGPRQFLSSITFLWGACMIGFGFVQRWDQMLGLRVILGVLEAGYFPGCVYLLSTWYPRYELQKRNAVFFAIGSLASAVSGILAYGIIQMDGLGNLSGWRWIFVIEGLITCVCGLIGYLLIVDFPELALQSYNFLTRNEVSYIVSLISQDRDDAIPTPFSLTTYLSNALDPKIWAFAWLALLAATNTYSIAYFLPVILHSGMHFSIGKSQCLVAPPYFAAALIMFAQAVLGDKHRIRGPFIIFNALLGLIGLPLLGYAHNNGIRYFGVFLATIGGNANIPAILTYQGNNIRGQWKRALCSATLVGFAGIGGIVGSTVFREQDAPRYGPGIMATMIANAGIVVITLGLMGYFWVVNKRGKCIEGLEGFRYTL